MLNERTWGQAVLEWVAVRERSASELLSLKKFSRYFKDRGLSAVTPEAVHEALSFCKTASTYMRYRAMIAAILNLAVDNGWLAKKLKLKERKQRTEKPRKWLTHEQFTKLYLALPEHLRAPAKFAVETGLRKENVLGLSWDRVDLKRKLVWVEAEDAKGGEPIAVPLSDGAVAVLEARKGAHKTWVFTYRGERFSSVKTGFQAACVRTGLGQVVKGPDGLPCYSGFTWHGFRHTWATWHVQSETPLDVLQKLGAWADLRMVMKYAHHSPGHLARFANNTKKGGA